MDDISPDVHNPEFWKGFQIMKYNNIWEATYNNSTLSIPHSIMPVMHKQNYLSVFNEMKAAQLSEGAYELRAIGRNPSPRAGVHDGLFGSRHCYIKKREMTIEFELE